MNQRAMTSEAGQSFGLPTMIFIVEEVGATTVTGTDQFGSSKTIPLMRRGKSLLPSPGERWLIDRSLGSWTLAAYLDGPIPVITGSRSAATAAVLEKLLQVLAIGGIIKDQTTA